MQLYGDALTLQEVRDSGFGKRPSFRKLLDLIDTSDPAWPLTAAVLREMTAAGADITAEVFAAAAKVGAYRLAKLDAGKERGRRPEYGKIGLAVAAGSIVYYVRRGDRIKIGTTVNPARRFAELTPDEILAFEPGGTREERWRHRQFDHLRSHGEYFRAAPELREHARMLRRLYGDPDPSWPSVATMAGKLAASRPLPPPLPAPVYGAKVTVKEAEALGIRGSRISAWVRRGKIEVAGYDEDGLRQFYVEHLVALRDKPARAVLDNPTTRV